MNKNINVGFTCAGGSYIIQNILCLRKIKGFNFKIIGLDKKKIENANEFFLDETHMCPDPKLNKKKYNSYIINFCKKKKIHILFVFSENEIKSLSLISTSDIKTILILPDKKFSNIADDKFKFLNYLKNFNIIKENFVKIDSIEDLKAALKMKAFNKKDLVLKPRMSRGSRGVIIIKKEVKLYHALKDRLCLVGNKKSILRFLNHNSINIKNYLLMEYFGDNVYDVDCFSIKGNITYLCQRQREYNNPLSPINEGCKIVNNKKINIKLKKLTKVLDITGIVDLDIAIDKKNEVHIIDVSSRLSGSAGSSIEVGMNIFESMIKYYLSNKVKKQFFKKSAKIRPITTFKKVAQ